MKILIILLIIFVLIYYKLNQQNIETFYTFFKPYYSDNDKENSNYNLYTQKLYNNLNYDNKYNYTSFVIATNNKNNLFLNLITKIILKTSHILYVDHLYYKNYEKMLKDLNNNKIQLINTSFSVFDQIHKNNVSNIRYVCTTDIKYIYICKRSDNYQFKNFSYIINNTEIGVLNKNSESHILIKSITEFIGLKENKDYKIKIYDDINKLLNDLNNNQITMAIFNDLYPTNIFTKYHNLELMELNGFRTNIFFEQYMQYYFKKSIDLNNLGTNYLPKNYETTVYTMFKPDFDVITYETFLLTNTKVEDSYIQDILKSINDNIYLLNRLPQYAKANIKYNASIMNKIVYGILPSNGTLIYLDNNGYISNIDNNNCKYFIGKDKCSEENLLLLT